MPGAPMEWQPDWYPLLKAAQWAGVPPWELVKQGSFWLHRILRAMEAESIAQENRSRQQAIGL